MHSTSAENDSKSPFSDADRELALLYVLRDPSLDLAAVEVRLMDDASFAECISEAALLCGAISSCSSPLTSETQRKSSSHGSSHSSSWRGIAWFSGLAASILLLISFTLLQGKSRTRQEIALASVADVWTSFQSETEASWTSDGSKGIVQEEAESVSTDSLPDWMVTATLAGFESAGLPDVH